MVVEKKERPLSETLPFKKNGTGKVDIDRDNIIRRISMLFHIVLDSGATPGITPIQDDLLNLVKKIRLVKGADDIKFAVDMVKWAIVEEIEKGTPIDRDVLKIPGAAGTETMEILINADFAQQRTNLSDFSALLDAPNETSLTLEVDWGDITNILETPNDTTVDAANSFVRVNLVEVFDDEEVDSTKLAKALAPNGFLDIREGIEKFNVTKANTSFDDSIQQEKIEPTPSRILTHLIVTKEDIDRVTPIGSPKRVNDIITQLKVENVKGSGEKILQSRFDLLHKGNKSEYGLERLFTGAWYIDWRDQRTAGLANFVAEALKWRFLTAQPVASETDAIELFTRYVSGDAR